MKKASATMSQLPASKDDEANKPMPGRMDRRPSYAGGRRPSFAGASMRPSFDGKKRPSQDEFDPSKIMMDEDTKRERRRASMNAISMTGSISFNSLSFNESDFEKDKTGLDKLWTVMTKAKESGMSVEQIFSFFKSDAGGDISPLDFQEGLEKIGPALRLTELELAEIFQVLDQDGDQTIDIAEFKDHCYKIPRLAWKAERIRMERDKRKSIELAEKLAANPPKSPSGAFMHKLEAQHAAVAAAAELADKQGSEMIYEGTKLFWRTHEKIDIQMHEYVQLHCLVVCAYNATRDVTQPTLILDKTKIEDTVDDDAVQAQLKAQREEYALRKAIVGRPLSAEEDEEVAEGVRRGILSNYVLLRLQQKELPETSDGACDLKFVTLSLDQYADGELVIENPGITELPTLSKKDKVDMAQFQRMSVEIRKTAGELSALSKSAERMSAIVSASMNAFGGGKPDPGHFAGISALNVTTKSGSQFSIETKRKVMRAILSSDVIKDIRKRKVAEMKARLESSVTYKALCEEIKARYAAEAEAEAAGPGGAAMEPVEPTEPAPP